MEDLIYKYLQNQITESERIQLEEWLAEDEENLKLFKNFAGHWNFSESDISLLKQKVWEKISREDEPVKGIRNHPSSNDHYGKMLLKIAAILTIVFGISFYFINSVSQDNEKLVTEIIPVMVEKIAGKGQKLTLRLPDGSSIKLNSDSKLTYPSDFSKESREVQLEGEAFFEVVKDEDRPFKIYSGEIEVKVLGTSFNVNTYPGHEEASVSVRSGKVSITDANRIPLTILTNQEKLILSNTDGLFRKVTIADEQMAYGWIDNFLTFNELNLEEAMSLVSRWFDIEYVINNKLNIHKQITAKFNNPSLKNVMENLSYSYEFNYEINKNGIIIK